VSVKLAGLPPSRGRQSLHQGVTEVGCLLVLGDVSTAPALHREDHLHRLPPEPASLEPLDVLNRSQSRAEASATRSQGVARLDNVQLAAGEDDQLHTVEPPPGAVQERGEGHDA